MNKNEITTEAARAAFQQYTDGDTTDEAGTLEAAARLADVRGDVETVGEDMSHYETSARAFLYASGVRFSARFLGFHDSREEWGEEDGESGCRVRGYIPVWRVSLSSASGRMSVRFRGSIHDGNEGRRACGVYSVLACLTKSEPGTLDEFGEAFGFYPIESAAAFRHARRVWNGCRREYCGVCRVWPSEDDRAALANIN